MEKKCSLNAKHRNIYLNGKKIKMASEIILYRYKNILQAQQTLEKFYISGKIK